MVTGRGSPALARIRSISAGWVSKVAVMRTRPVDDGDPPGHFVLDGDRCGMAGDRLDEHGLGGSDNQAGTRLISRGSANVDHVAVETNAGPPVMSEVDHSPAAGHLERMPEIVTHRCPGRVTAAAATPEATVGSSPMAITTETASLALGRPCRAAAGPAGRRAAGPAACRAGSLPRIESTFTSRHPGWVASSPANQIPGYYWERTHRTRSARSGMRCPSGRGQLLMWLSRSRG